MAFSGDWNVASNWSPPQVPTTAVDVTINQPGATVTVNDAESVNSLTTASGTTLALIAGAKNESRPR